MKLDDACHAWYLYLKNYRLYSSKSFSMLSKCINESLDKVRTKWWDGHQGRHERTWRKWYVIYVLPRCGTEMESYLLTQLLKATQWYVAFFRIFFHSQVCLFIFGLHHADFQQHVFLDFMSKLCILRLAVFDKKTFSFLKNSLLRKAMAYRRSCCLFLNILRLFDVLPNFAFTARETMRLLFFINMVYTSCLKSCQTT